MKNHTRLGLLATALVTMVAPALVLGMSTSAQASDSPPWNTKAPFIVDGGNNPITAASVGWDITCKPGTWQAGDGDVVDKFEYAFYRDSSLQIDDDAVYRVTADDKGHSITCRVRAATADSDYSSEHSTNPVTVAGTPTTPGGDSAPSLQPGSYVWVSKPSPFYTGYSSSSTLTCKPGSWDNDDDADVYYKWTRNGSEIDGADESTYLTTAFDSRAKIACLVAKDNGYATSGFAQSEPVLLPKYKGTPVNRQAPTVSGTAKKDKTLTCNPGTWFNAKNFAYRWYYSSSATPGVAGTHYANGKTLTLTGNDVGNYYYCTVSAAPPSGSWDGPSSYVESSNRSKQVTAI